MNDTIRLLFVTLILTLTQIACFGTTDHSMKDAPGTTLSEQAAGVQYNAASPGQSQASPSPTP